MAAPLGRPEAPGLLERSTELETLALRLEASRSGTGQLVVVTGPAGIGKTSLLNASADWARANCEVLRAQADPVSAEASFAVVRELLEPATRKAHDAIWQGAAERAGPVFVSSESDELDRDRAASVLYGLYWLVAGLAERRPLVLLVDDAHWLDAASLRFVAYLAARLASLPVLVVLGARSGEGRSEALMQVAARAGGAVLRPAPLGPGAVSALIDEALGSDADPELCAQCYRVTAGNPLYLRELISALAIDPELGRAMRSGLAPAAGGIEANVATRLAGLGPDCISLARVAAVLGPGSQLRTAAALSGLERERAVRAADALRGVGLFAKERALSFVHPVVADAVLSGIPASERAAMHAAAARRFLADGRGADQAAAHLVQAEPFGEPWVVEALRTAARHALSQGAPDVAASYLRRALAEPPPPEQRLTVMVELGRIETLLPGAFESPSGSTRQAFTLAENPQQRAELTVELAETLAAATSLRPAYTLLEDLLAAPDGVDPSLLVRAEATLIGAGLGDLAATGLPERVAHGVARVLAGELDEPRMLAALALTGAATGLEAETAADLARRALASRTLLEELWSAWAGAVFALVISDHPVEAAAAAEAGIAHARRRGAAATFVAMSWAASSAALCTGELSAAAAHSERALELLSEEHLPVRWILGTHVPVLIESGREEEADRVMKGFDLSPREHDDVSSVIALAARGLTRVATGELQTGVADLLTADATMASAGRWLSRHLDWGHTATRALLALGRRAEAERIAERELASATSFGARRSRGIALMLRGMLDPSPTGVDALREAVEVFVAASARLEQARALVELGTALLARGQSVEGREALQAGLDLADRCGGLALCRRARSELVAAGARPRRNARQGPGALTPAERRTALMAAEGMANREIAQALFVSVKTVEGQLAAAYLKLGVHNRRELPGALRGA
jgi:DNA-binding CsgD family transcriptional regulator